jgi:ribosomal protein S18 acetylase RimI-like enzyme
VPPPEVVPFTDDDLDAAAALLAARHARHRAVEPLLSPRYAEPSAAREEVERLWRTDGASGAAAFRGGRLAGYLLGAPRTDPMWGDNVFVEAGGQAVDVAEDVRDLYGLASTRWVDEGRPRHSVVAPAHDAALLDAWWRLSFGQQHAYALQAVPASSPSRTGTDDGIEIRDPREEELEELIDLDLALPEHHGRAPVFGGLPGWSREESRNEWLKTFANDEEKVLIAAVGGRPVGCWALVPVERSSEHRGLLQPDDACHLGFAVTLPDARGRGIGLALMQASLAWAAEQGYAAMTTDWRITNLLASRFWPRRGFRTSFLRLYRAIP